MRALRAAALPLILLALAACTDDPALTSTGVQGALAGPQISELVARPDTNGNISLQVKAVDSDGSPLTFKWQADQGELSARSGPSVLWRPPKQAGIFTATVEVTNGKGVTRKASQQFKVNGDGQATTSGSTVITSAPSGTATGSSGFQLPPTVPNGTPSIFVVDANPNAPGPGAPSPSPPFNQPVATLAPGASPNPTAGPGQPIALPTLTPSPATPQPSPAIPTPPATSEPGVPVPPTSVWVQLDPARVPTRNALETLHFVPGAGNTYQNGWAASANEVIRTTDSGQTWAFASNGIPSNAGIKKIFFTSGTAGALSGGGFDQAGFVAGAGNVLRTVDLGANWQSIAPPFQPTSGFNVLLVYNSRNVVIATADGRVMRSQNANAASNLNVSWDTIETKPATRPEDCVTSIRAGACFAPDPTLAYFVGDGIYRMDTDNPTPSQTWKRLVNLNNTEDGEGCSVQMTSQSDIWVGTTAGRLFHSADGGNTWTKSSSYFNREHNGNDQTFTGIGALNKLNFFDATTGFMLAGAYMYDTRNGGASWRQDQGLSSAPADFQIGTNNNGGTTTFFGWACGYNGVIQRYVSTR